MTKNNKIISLIIKVNIPYGIVVLLFLFLASDNLVSQVNVDQYDVKKTLIYTITGFVEWSQSSKVNTSESPIVISIIGENPFNGKLKSMANNKQYKIKSKLITVRYIKSIEEIKGSDILFISSSERYNISKIIKYTHKKPILTIGDTKGYMEKGVMIGLILRSGRIWFSINKKEANECGFYINSQLLGNAFKVIK